MSFGSLCKKYSVPIWTFFIFTFIGLIMWIIRDWRYFSLFSGIGLTELVARTLVIARPESRQTVRRVMHALIASILLVMLGLVFGVNFQFEQIFFDFEAGILTGALIQLVIARLVIPFIFGNAFCSRACWDGFIFESIQKKPVTDKTFRRREWLAWCYIAIIILMTIFVSYMFVNPADPDYDNANIILRRRWIIGSNILIITMGYILSIFGGSRFYCRNLCPFMTISSLLYRFSWFRITPVDADKCSGCGRCNDACPMLVDVRSAVSCGEQVSNRQCILCERCVSACNRGVLAVAHRPVKRKE